MGYKKTIFLLIITGIIVGLSAQLPGVHNFNLMFSHWLQSWQPIWLVRLSESISLVEYFSIPLSLVISVYFLSRKQKTTTILILLAGFSWIMQMGLKTLFNVPCPTPQEVLTILPFHGLINLTSVCYPSGHVFDYVSLWGMIYYVTKQKWVKYLALFLITTIGVARLMLGAHLLTDVIGGYLFGFAWLFFLMSLFPSY